MKFISLVVLIITVVPLCLFAAISADTTSTELKPELSAARATTQFVISNDGDGQVVISDIRVSCHCTTTTIENSVLPPHSKTILHTSIDISTDAGRIDRYITIYTKSPKSMLRLAVRLDLPDIVQLSAQNVQWHINDPPNPKLITISMAPKINGKIVSVTPKYNLLKTSTKITDNGDWTISIVPPSTQVGYAGFEMLDIDALITIDGKEILKTQHFAIPVNVRGKQEN